MLRNWILNELLPLSSFFGNHLGSAMKLLAESDTWSKNDLRNHQENQLALLMQHCYRNVPYYRDLMNSRGLKPADFRNTADLAKLPYLTRDIIRKEGDRLRAENYPDTSCKFRRSGGTTGEPIRVAVDARARGYETAAYLRGFKWMNYCFGKPQVRLFGGSLGIAVEKSFRGVVENILFNNHFIPAFELTLNNVGSYVQVVQGARDGVLIGYASAIMNMANYMSQRGFSGSPLKSVICTAEYLPEEWRGFIQNVFQAPVFTYYGCGEVHSLGYECSGEKGYIIPQEHVILEVRGNLDSEFNDQGRGETAITTLFNFAMPLIRYLNGDILELGYESSGHAHARIVNIEGRVLDQLLTTDGQLISGAFSPHLILKTKAPVIKYQVIQNDYDKIDFHYELKDDLTLTNEVGDVLASIFRKYLGENMKVTFVKNSFETSKSRKHRFVINKVLASRHSTTSGKKND